MQTYNPDECAIFCRIKERYGALSNMASGFPITYKDKVIPSSEHLYQITKFIGHDDIIQKILMVQSPYVAKQVSLEYKGFERPDWLRIREKVMKWSCRLKLESNMETFGAVLFSTGDKSIVELSMKDDFWGAKPKGHFLVGNNRLGVILTQLRDEYKDSNNV